MDKGIITVFAASIEDAKQIREEFKNSEYSKYYKLNILISGNEDIKTNLKNFLLARIRA